MIIPILKCFTILFLALVVTLVQAEEITQNKDVTYVAIVKNKVYQQDMLGNVKEIGYSFLGYIFVKQDSQISDAFLMIPGKHGRREAFPDYRNSKNIAKKDTYLFIRNDESYTDKKEFDKNYSDGTYKLEFTTSEGKHRGEITLDGGEYPLPAILKLYQSGIEIRSDSIVPTKDLRVTWGGFPQGKADANGILDDVVFIIVQDCHGAKILHSGRPFQGFHLLYSDKDYVITANTMLQGKKICTGCRQWSGSGFKYQCWGARCRLLCSDH